MSRPRRDLQSVTGLIYANASPNSAHSPTDIPFSPQADIKPSASGCATSQSALKSRRWRPVQDFHPLLATTGPPLPPASVPGHLITAAEASANCFPVTLINTSEAQASLARQAFQARATYATSASQAPFPSFTPNPTPHTPKCGTRALPFFSNLDSYIYLPPNSMGLPFMHSNEMSNMDPQLECPKSEDSPPPKRMRFDEQQLQANLDPAIQDPHELPPAEDVASPAASEAHSHGYSPRRGFTYKREGEPPKNEEGKMICAVDDACRALTFDRKCEWGSVSTSSLVCLY